MRKSALLIVVSLILMVSCKKDQETTPTNNTNNNQTEKKVTLKGQVLNTKSDSVAKVLVFNLNKQYYLSNVINGQFSIDITIGKIYGVLFLNNANQMLGYLKLNSDLDFLPLTKVSDTISTINLETLTAQGAQYIPASNPLGTSLIYTSSEQQMLAMFDDVASSTIKHPDANQNGIIDLLENKLFYMQLLYFMEGGVFENNNLTPTINNQVSVSGYRFAFVANDTLYPSTITFTDPNHQFMGNNEGYKDFDNTRLYWGPFITNMLPTMGIYTIGYNSQQIIIEVPDQSYIPTNVVTAIPTVELSTNGTIKQISWYYRTPNSTTILDPKSLIKRIMIQIDDSQHNRLYNSENISPQEVTHVLSDPTISWANVSYLMMTYEDIFGNQNIITFRK
ncbi:MAG: hypothetical protein HPY79_01420 [Bacteroidales bacterium]|nr:hypothetical protein [Bacteroidales bacterium]